MSFEWTEAIPGMEARMSLTSIEWTDATWNPVTGCDKISPGCKHCYAERMAMRLKAMGQANYADGFKVTLQPQMLEAPLRWRGEPRKVFVNSMSDLFHADVPFEYIDKVFAIMKQAHEHTFQILTKRPERMAEFMNRMRDDLAPWPLPNVWLGVSCETQAYADLRIPALLDCPAVVRFISAEPLLGPINLGLRPGGIHWVIVGGESGPGARPMERGWVRDIHYECQQAKVPFFFKQWGGVHKIHTGRILDGRTWDEMPCLILDSH